MSSDVLKIFHYNRMGPCGEVNALAGYCFPAVASVVVCDKIAVQIQSASVVGSNIKVVGALGFNVKVAGKLEVEEVILRTRIE